MKVKSSLNGLRVNSKWRKTQRIEFLKGTSERLHCEGTTKNIVAISSVGYRACFKNIAPLPSSLPGREATTEQRKPIEVIIMVAVFYP